jgi:hypothetical protein
MTASDVDGDPATDRAAVEALLGRPVQGAFEVAVRHPDGSPLVIRNAPLLDDGTPMPTRYWLVGEPERAQVGRLEAAGGVRQAEAEVDAAELADAHRRYAAERDAAVPAEHDGPRPSGGVGGTQRGVKCLHAHYAWHLAGGEDPVGRWVEERLARVRAQVRVKRVLDDGASASSPGVDGCGAQPHGDDG